MSYNVKETAEWKELVNKVVAEIKDMLRPAFKVKRIPLAFIICALENYNKENYLAAISKHREIGRVMAKAHSYAVDTLGGEDYSYLVMYRALKEIQLEG